MTSTTRTASDVKARILEAAADEFMRQGLDGATIDDIADRVGATKGLIYYHFRSKFDIFLAVYESAMQNLIETVEAIAEQSGTGRQRLEAMSVAHVVNLMEHLADHLVVQQGVRNLSSAAMKPRQRDAFRDLNGLRVGYEVMFLAVVTEGVEDGSLRDLDAALATRTLLSSLNAVDAWYRDIDGQSHAERLALATAIVGLILGGLAPHHDGSL